MGWQDAHGPTHKRTPQPKRGGGGGCEHLALLREMGLAQLPPARMVTTPSSAHSWYQGSFADYIYEQTISGELPSPSKLICLSAGRAICTVPFMTSRRSLCYWKASWRRASGAQTGTQGGGRVTWVMRVSCHEGVVLWYYIGPLDYRHRRAILVGY